MMDIVALIWNGLDGELEEVLAVVWLQANLTEGGGDGLPVEDGGNGLPEEDGGDALTDEGADGLPVEDGGNSLSCNGLGGDGASVLVLSWF